MSHISLFRTYYPSSLHGSRLERALLIGFGLLALVLTANYKIPLQPVPVSMQLVMVMAIGFLMSRKDALTTVGLYVAAALLVGPPIAAGNPFFTGGYLVGYIVAALLVSVIWGAGMANGSRNWLARAAIAGASTVSAIAVVHACGVAWLYVAMLGVNPQQTFTETVAVGVLPFLTIDLIKAGTLATAMAFKRD